MRLALYRALAFAVPLAFLFSPANAAEDPLDEAKTLYASASFENALAALNRLDAATSKAPDVLQYKALCLLALGRSSEAQTVVDTLVSTSPAFLPEGEDLSPRFLALFGESRRRLLPEITKRAFISAREQFGAKHYSVAKEQFEQVLGLVEDRTWRDTSDAGDLRTLASGFLELVDAASAAASTPTQGAASESPSAGTRLTAVAAAEPARQNVELQPPVAIEQSLPKWRPTDAVTAQRHFTGAVRVRIGTDGHVVSATIEVATDPNYDKQLLVAARSWRYVPGRRNGEPIEMEKRVTFSLRTN